MNQRYGSRALHGLFVQILLQIIINVCSDNDRVSGCGAVLTKRQNVFLFRKPWNEAKHSPAWICNFPILNVITKSFGHKRRYPRKPCRWKRRDSRGLKRDPQRLIAGRSKRCGSCVQTRLITPRPQQPRAALRRRSCVRRRPVTSRHVTASSSG